MFSFRSTGYAVQPQVNGRLTDLNGHGCLRLASNSLACVIFQASGAGSDSNMNATQVEAQKKLIQVQIEVAN